MRSARFIHVQCVDTRKSAFETDLQIYRVVWAGVMRSLAQKLSRELCDVMSCLSQMSADPRTFESPSVKLTRTGESYWTNELSGGIITLLPVPSEGSMCSPPDIYTFVKGRRRKLLQNDHSKTVYIIAV